MGASILAGRDRFSLDNGMDLRLLSLTADSDLSDVLHILTGITVSSLAAGAASDAGPEPARQHYLHTVQLLKRGMAAPQPISH